MMTSQILKFVDFAKTQKSRYLQNETPFFLQIKKIICYTSRATLWQKSSFVTEVTFNKTSLVTSRFFGWDDFCRLSFLGDLLIF